MNIKVEIQLLFNSFKQTLPQIGKPNIQQQYNINVNEIHTQMRARVSCVGLLDSPFCPQIIIKTLSFRTEINRFEWD